MAEPLLDDEQQAVATIAAAHRQIVLAPPGSGKTEVVVQLLRHLVEDEGLSPYDEILVITFSRSAIHALQRRSKASGVIGVGIRTLDSLASEILHELDEDDDWIRSPFDARILRAVHLLQEQGIPEWLAQVRHVIVDEAQDVVGARANLVLSVLRSIHGDAGFSLLGDPLQAIYNFQLSEDSDTTSRQFLDEVRKLGPVQDHRLTAQYRARTPEPRQAAGLGLNELDDMQRVVSVREFVARLLMSGDIGALAEPMRRWGGMTAFLCRDNGLALEVAQQLRTHGASVTVRAPADQLPIAPWLGRALEGKGTSVRRGDIEDLLDETPLGAEGSWRLLKAIERDFRTPTRLDLDRLASALLRGAVPIDLRATESQALVSTIHRSKGLEFDNVVLINPRDLLPSGSTIDDAAVAYVAVTRARDRLLAARCETPRFLRKDTGTGRWIVGGHERWMTRCLEIRALDSAPAGVEPSGEAHLSIGRVVEGRINPVASTLARPVWDLVLDARTVARTTLEFADLFVRRIRPRKTGVPWPTLEGLVVESVETRVCLDAAGRKYFVAAPRISGMAELGWTT